VELVVDVFELEMLHCFRDALIVRSRALMLLYIQFSFVPADQ
jgi:hypothetical protein